MLLENPFTLTCRSNDFLWHSESSSAVTLLLHADWMMLKNSSNQGGENSVTLAPWHTRSRPRMLVASKAVGAIHLTKISGNSGTKSNGTERFWKFVSKIVDNLRRLSFFPEIWKFRKFPVPFGISTRFELTPVPLVVKSYKMATSKSVESTLHWMQNDLPRLEPVLDRKRKR